MFIYILTDIYCVYNTCARLNRDSGVALLFLSYLHRGW